MPRTRVVPLPVLRRIVEGATRAPSVHNTQPWRWRAGPDSLELFADPTRRLGDSDPDGRALVISCGAALHHAQVVAAARGWVPEVTRHPDPAQVDLLARIDLAPRTPPADGREVLDRVEQRCTDRRRFTSWPVPDERLRHLAGVADRWGTTGLALTDAMQRFRAERLILQAADRQEQRRSAVLERDAWLDRSVVDGIPLAALTDSGVLAGAPHHRFENVPDTDLEGQDLQLADGLVVLCDSVDDRTSWLRAGEGLSAMWLAATAAGLSVVPLSQVVEEDETRRAFRVEVLGGAGHPLVLARVGWQPIGRSDLVRTPRRPVSEVLDLDQA
jgi:nitroreductase